VTSEDEDDEELAGSSMSLKEPEHKKTKIGVDETVGEIAQDLQDIAAEQLKDIKQAPASRTAESGESSSAGKAKAKKISPSPTPITVPSSKAKPNSAAGKSNNKGKGKVKIDPDEDEEEAQQLDEDAGTESLEDGEDGEDDDLKEEADKKEMNEAAMKLASTYAGTLDSVTQGGFQWKEGTP
jgi:hypothetical protein